MRAILMSIKHKWCEKIFSGEKTIEVRKTAPKLKPPFKVYMYESLGKKFSCSRCEGCPIRFPLGCNEGAGAVVGEFVCCGIEYSSLGSAFSSAFISGKDCLTTEEREAYRKGVWLIGWGITKPKQYDTPKELSEFWTVRCTNKTGECKTCEVKPACISNITRAPQSWMYVEEIEE